MNKYQEALDELCGRAMECVEDYDYDENIRIEYWYMDKEPLDKLREPLQELVDKVTPKKPYKGDWVYLCPTCNMPNVYDYEYDKKFRCCSECGQRLDWSEEDD